MKLPNLRKCGCGCGESPRYPGARFVHGHHLRLKQFQRKPQIRPPKICPQCGQEFFPKKWGSYTIAKFCSRYCSTQGHIKHRRCCLNCSAIFIPSNGRSVNCSMKCRMEWAVKQGKPGSYQSNARKVFIRKCADCGFDKEPRVILIHHIDGNRQNGQITNLIPLCPTCHEIRHLEMKVTARPSSEALRAAP